MVLLLLLLLTDLDKLIRFGGSGIIVSSYHRRRRLFLFDAAFMIILRSNVPGKVPGTSVLQCTVLRVFGAYVTGTIARYYAC